MLHSSKPRSVLLVDDETGLRASVAHVMRLLGFDAVAEAGDGADALAILDESPVDLIVTDFQMPTMDGITLVRALRQRGDLTPIIMLSGQDDQRIISRAKRAGVTGYIMKPVDAMELSEMIERTMREPARSRRC